MLIFLLGRRLSPEAVAAASFSSVLGPHNLRFSLFTTCLMISLVQLLDLFSHSFVVNIIQLLECPCRAIGQCARKSLGVLDRDTGCMSMTSHSLSLQDTSVCVMFQLHKPQ